MSVDRRAVLTGTLLAAGLVAGGAASAQPSRARDVLRPEPPQVRWPPPPPQAPATEGFIDVGGAKLWYWDTGGRGEPIVLMHAFTGSAASWPYQQPAFARAGYRVIAYSRRGHHRSEVGPRDDTGSAARDLHTVVEALKLGRFHYVGTAAGGFIGPDYALLHPERLYSMTLACTQGGATDRDYRAAITRTQPREFSALSAELREVSPTYRLANPEGLEAWKALEHLSTDGRPRTNQTPINDLNWANIEKIRTPTLLFTGDADLLAPPALMRIYATHLSNCETATIAEAGHSAFWEQPEAFNRLVLSFVRRHGARRRG